MIVRRPDYYMDFHCLGGSCPDTCCRDWSVVLDGDAMADYAGAPSPLQERIAQALATDEDGDVCFRLGDDRQTHQRNYLRGFLVLDGLCALLAPDGLCTIQRDWGEAHLCGHCAAYPRFTEEYGCLSETALAISCPEAARLLLEAPRFALIEADDGQDQPPFDGVDPELLHGLEQSRAQILALLDIRDRPPVAREREYITSWIDMGFPDEAIRLAYEKTVLKKQSMSWPYMNSILKNWHEKGLHTAKEIAASDSVRAPRVRPGAGATAPQPSAHGEADRRAREDMERLRAFLKRQEKEGN